MLNWSVAVVTDVFFVGAFCDLFFPIFFPEACIPASSFIYSNVVAK